MQRLDRDPLVAIGSYLDIKSLCLFQSADHKLTTDLAPVRTVYINLWQAAIKAADDRVTEDYRIRFFVDGARPNFATFNFRVAHSRVSAFIVLIGLGCVTKVPRRFLLERDRARAIITAAQFAQYSTVRVVP